MAIQIKSKKRVSEHGEVFTNKREVNAMLDMVQDEITKLKSTVLEPACGNGNFLIEILKRKMNVVNCIYRSQYEYELYSMLVFSTIYGLDIQKDNVLEARTRLMTYFMLNYELLFNSRPSKNIQTALKFILQKNVQCANSLNMQNEKKQSLIISEWNLCENGTIIRKDVYYKDLINGIEHNYIKSYSYKWMRKNEFIGGLNLQYA